MTYPLNVIRYAQHEGKLMDIIDAISTRHIDDVLDIMDNAKKANKPCVVITNVNGMQTYEEAISWLSSDTVLVIYDDES